MEKSPDASTIQAGSYPGVSLPRIIEMIRKIDPGHWSDRMTAEQVVVAMGYGGLSGTAKAALASARHYGLINKDGATFGLTALGRRILDPSDDDDAREAIGVAAVRPRIFAILRARMQGGASEVEMQSILEEEGLSSWAIGRVRQAYVETTSLVEASLQVSTPRGLTIPGSHQPIDGRPAGSQINARRQSSASVGDLGAPTLAAAPVKLFAYRFETGEELAVTLTADVPTKAVIAAINGWLGIKRGETHAVGERIEEAS